MGAVARQVLAVCCFLVLVAAWTRKRYDNYQVLRIVPKTEDEVGVIKELRTRFPRELDFWSEPMHANSPIDVMVPPNLQSPILRFLKQNTIHYDTIMENVQGMIDEQIQQASKAKDDRRSGTTLENFDYSVYHTMDEINDWMTYMVTSYPNLTEKITVMESYEGREVWGLKIRKSSSRKAPAIFFEGGIHSREWISPATMLYFIKELLEKYESDRVVRKLVSFFDWYIVPVLNPDGYIYTWTTDRMWRKSREPNEGSPCVGTDLNRNWGFGWAAPGGSSDDPCTIIYHGAGPNSTPEINGTQQFLSDLHTKQGLAFFVDWHSYGQMWLAPWAFTYDYPEDYSHHLKLAEELVGKLTSWYGTQYRYGPTSHVIYPASGSSLDWVHGALGVKHAYAAELRDHFYSPYGFLLPERQIIPTAQETWAGVKAAAMYILKNEL
ncbi:carboxypeptidase B-like [Ptychodera flava]|uniref:carboxypeptidase B-like n=1 Tax=Ptychodera flava TaxID=63121 RepID=UPI003969EA6D